MHCGRGVICTVKLPRIYNIYLYCIPPPTPTHTGDIKQRGLTVQRAWLLIIYYPLILPDIQVLYIESSISNILEFIIDTASSTSPSI